MENTVFSPLNSLGSLVENNLTMHEEFVSGPLTCCVDLYVCMSIPHCLDSCGSEGSFEISTYETTNFFSRSFGYSRTLEFPHNFRLGILVYAKMLRFR